VKDGVIREDKMGGQVNLFMEKMRLLRISKAGRYTRNDRKGDEI